MATGAPNRREARDGDPLGVIAVPTPPLASTSAGLEAVSAQLSNLYPRSCLSGRRVSMERVAIIEFNYVAMKSFDSVPHSGRNGAEAISAIAPRVPSSLAVFFVLPPLDR